MYNLYCICIYIYIDTCHVSICIICLAMTCTFSAIASRSASQDTFKSCHMWPDEEKQVAVGQNIKTLPFYRRFTISFKDKNEKITSSRSNCAESLSKSLCCFGLGPCPNINHSNLIPTSQHIFEQRLQTKKLRCEHLKLG